MTEQEARMRVLANVRPLAATKEGLAAAVGRFSTEDRVAEVALPGFDNSAMDGYAVVASSSPAGARLQVIGEQPAGFDRHLTVRPGEAVRILTGAPLPRGADAVIMQEDISPAGDEILLNEAASTGEFIRRRGGDVAEGQKIVGRGERITPQLAALLAAQGWREISVGARPKVAIISTGDELAAPGTPLQRGQIYDSNTTLLQALSTQAGARVRSVIHCRDAFDELVAAIRQSLQADILILTGGVSVGARDLVKPALTACGATLDLWRVAVKPGKPFLFGYVRGCSIFGLPGNPVSAFVTFLLFVRPAILRLAGAGDEHLALPRTTVRIAEEVSNPSDRPHYVRGSVRHGMFQPVGRQESHAVFGLSRSDALLLVPPGGIIAEGRTADAFLFD